MIRNLFTAIAFSASCFPSLFSQWVQMGSTLAAQYPYEQFGNFVEMSANGNSIICTSWYNYTQGLGVGSGGVRVYDWSGTDWVQRGDLIEGEDEDVNAGTGIALSHDGIIAVVGSPSSHSNDFIFNGYVRVYSWDGNQWLPMGQRINGSESHEYLGWSVDLSADGLVLVAGGRGSSPSVFGKTRIFDFNGTSWVERPSLQGEQLTDFFGSSVKVSADGNKLVVGAPGYSPSGSAISNGKAHTFVWNGSVWEQRGTAIVGSNQEDLLGQFVDLSDDGNVLLVVSERDDTFGPNAGKMEVFFWNGTDWESDETFYGSGAEVGFGRGRLSNDGLTVVVPSRYADTPDTDAGSVSVFRGLGGTWVQQAQTLTGPTEDAQLGWWVATNQTGSRIVAGMPLYGSLGSAQVFENQSYNSVGESVQPEWKLFPNPVQGTCEVQGLEEPIEAELHDARGQLLRKMHLSSSENLVDVSAFERGVYFVVLKGPTSQTALRLVKN